MTTITISKRFCIVVSRWLKMNWKKMILTGINYPNNEKYSVLETIYNGDIEIKSFECQHYSMCKRRKWNVKEHFETEFIDHVKDEDNCPCKKGIYFKITYVTDEKQIFKYKFYQDQDDNAVNGGNDHDYTDDDLVARYNMDEVIEYIKSLEGKTFTTCKHCDAIAIEDGMCKQCYIYGYTRTEEEGGDCAVCMQNGGRWVGSINCSHIICMGCNKKLQKKECPLCRTSYKGKDSFIRTFHDPYDK